MYKFPFRVKHFLQMYKDSYCEARETVIFDCCLYIPKTSMLGAPGSTMEPC